jgi:hypothetical protein
MRKMMIAYWIALFFATAQGQNGQRFVVLPESESKAVADFYPRTGAEKVGGSWQATTTDIDGLEANLSQLSELRRKTGRWLCASSIQRSITGSMWLFYREVKGEFLSMYSAAMSLLRPSRRRSGSNIWKSSWTGEHASGTRCTIQLPVSL